MASTTSFAWSHLGLVVLGGALGALARASLLWMVPADLAIPALAGATMVVNLVGALVLGTVVGALDGRHPAARAFLGTGILGGFTTYSAFAVQVVALAPVAPGVTLAVAGVSVIGGVVLAALGLRVGRRRWGHRAGASDAPEEAE